jgi:hypothetical protein
MAVRLDTRGPFTVYRFERRSTHRVTLELPAVMVAQPPPLKRIAADPPVDSPPDLQFSVPM